MKSSNVEEVPQDVQAASSAPASMGPTVQRIECDGCDSVLAPENVTVAPYKRNGESFERHHLVCPHCNKSQVRLFRRSGNTLQPIAAGVVGE